MHPRSRACCRAAQRQIRASTGIYWITDEVLLSTFQQFCRISVSSRRNGSSVPGPMEGRRRVGKRRMTNGSGAMRSSTPSFSALWAFNNGIFHDQWQWEAPLRRPAPATDAEAPILPVWLRDLGQAAYENLSLIPAIDDTLLSDQREISVDFENGLPWFREALKAVSEAYEIIQICDIFTKKFKQNLTLGLISEDALTVNLRCFTTAVGRKRNLDSELVGALCLSFYEATWDGMKACKVLSLTDFGIPVLNRLLYLVSQLPASAAVAIQVTDMLDTLARPQLLQLEDGIMSVIGAWLPRWEIETSTSETDRHTRSFKTTSTDGAMQDFLAFKTFVRSLASSIGHVAPQTAHNVIRTATAYMIATKFRNFKGTPSTLRNMRYLWVSMVARSICTDEHFLASIWLMLEFTPNGRTKYSIYRPSIRRMTLREGCNIVLDFWMSQGKLSIPVPVHDSLREAIDQCDPVGAAPHLLETAGSNHELRGQLASSLFRILRYLRRLYAIPLILRSLKDKGVELPTQILVAEIKHMSSENPTYALHIYNSWFRSPQGQLQLPIDSCTDLVIAMINDPTFHPGQIWATLGVKYLFPRQTWQSGKKLDAARINLVHKMAWAFCRAKCRPHRVAQRNVLHCAVYLRGFNVPICSDVTRALSYVGITRDVLRGHRTGASKLNWILSVVEKVEGQEVSTAMNEALDCWQTQLLQEKQHQRRKANPLKFGPIG